MDIKEIKENAECLKHDIVKMLRNFEEKYGVTINLTVYHRIFTFDEEMRTGTINVYGKKEQIVDINLTLSL